jgi:hypothetical protein
MAHRPGHREGGGSRRGQFGRSQGGGADRAGNRYRDMGGVAGGYGEKKRTINFPFGGGGGGQRGSHFAGLDFEYQKELDRMIWERSTPDVTGVGGQVRWDRDKNMVTSTLSPENQAIYDAMIERQQMFGGQADALGGGGWQDAQQTRFDQMRSMYSEGDAQAQQQRLAREQATGASSTGRYMGARTEQDAINQRDLGLQNQAFLESQQLIDSNLARQYGAVGMMQNVGNIANSMIKMPQPYPQGNMLGVSEASTAWRDLQALEAAKRSKGRSDAWGSILGGMGGGKIVCTAMNDDYGFGSYRNAIWLKYAELNYKDKPEMEKGYHAIFKPLLKIRKKWYGKPIYAWMKHVARHRSVDLRAEMYGKKRDRIGQAWRFVLEPLCYLVGKRLVNK